MGTDIRIDSTWINHRKRWRLFDALGNDGVIAIMDLWLYASEHFKGDGILRGMSDTDISRAAQYHGNGNLVKTLVDVGLLDAPKKPSDPYKLHNWTLRQPYLVFAKARSVAASHAAKTRWKQKTNIDAARIDPHMRKPCERNAPNPNPNPNPKTPLTVICLNPEYLLSLWNKRAKGVLRPAKSLTPERERAAKARIREHSDPAEWETVFSRMAKSAFCRGEQNKPGQHENWKADFDFAMRPGTFTRVLEGGYGCDGGENSAGNDDSKAEENRKIAEREMAKIEHGK